MAFDIVNRVDRHQLAVPCPSCGYFTDVRLREARMEAAILCAGCHSTIVFREDGVTRAGIRQVAQAERELNRVLDDTRRKLRRVLR